MKPLKDLTWDLEIIFPGGSKSTKFREHLTIVDQELDKLDAYINQLQPKATKENIEALIDLCQQMESTTKLMREAFAFISCLHAQDTNDQHVQPLLGERSQLNAKFGGIQTKLKQKLGAITEEDWSLFSQHESLQEIIFVLEEYREQAQNLLPLEQEALINDLAKDGYHAWGQMYDVIVGNMEITLEEKGSLQHYSIGQATNKLTDPNRRFRQHVFTKLSAAWEEQADLFGQTINHLAGFRLETYKHRGWENVLKEPLMINRMKQETLDAMWTAITKYKGQFVHYLNKKAELLDIDTLSIYDVTAPISETVQTYTYEEGANFIVDQFRKFSPKMADFAEMAFEKRWIEAEDRPGKRPGGFCTSFPHSEQTRIFMTYSGTASNIATLAHELGHAYHQHVMNDVNALNQRYAMNVAETASTFAEMIVADASLQAATSKEEKKALLEDKIQRSVAFFMNIHARFLFETRFYEERKQGIVSVERLNQLMVEAQKEAYCETLSEYDPNFWASKLHFHITGVPFYNFPYTFGYLFSNGVYAKAKNGEGSFEEAYISLLRDTGRMTVEDLAKKHLNVDLTETAFWEEAVLECMKDVDEFMKLV
ncbi:M3 family oligoendopeptidase [Virgibacillus dokdonensis]|uniref:Oligoendopeptidase F, plasmid n=1 Tax=Virgibacillus dokdonensis TaxID=302167 RepID=A0A2K9J4K3_9BACI|nr:M3 family oligoendopeptidase [Virgibacillus dokdonensis]AUJ26878.1 Oligoendopeptidase F, plasmid [Virgibacillus dokdonensis]